MKLNYIQHMFLGLLEGDGSIQVNHWKKRILQFRILIKLKYTPQNYILCTVIQKHLGCMNLHVRHNYVLLIENDQKKLRTLMHLIETHGLLTKHARQRYAFFHYCFHAKPKLSEYFFLKENVHMLQPLYSCPERTVSDMLQLTWIDGWVVGFVEAEGCFCIRRNGRLSFSIGQKDDRTIIECIQRFFQMANAIQVKKQGMFVIEGGSRPVLSRIIAFFEHYSLYGEKKIQFEKFVQVFHTPLSR